MATLRSKRKLAAVTGETHEENPRNGQSRNTSVPRINEEYITQVFEQIKGRVTEKLSQEFSRTESRILGALSKLDEFLLNQQITTHSGTVPGTFRNTNVKNQGTNEDDSQSDPHPEAGIFRGQTTQNSSPKDCRDSEGVVLLTNGWITDHSPLGILNIFLRTQVFRTIRSSARILWRQKQFRTKIFTFSEYSMMMILGHYFVPHTWEINSTVLWKFQRNVFVRSNWLGTDWVLYVARLLLHVILLKHYFHISFACCYDGKYSACNHLQVFYKENFMSLKWPGTEVSISYVSLVGSFSNIMIQLLWFYLRINKLVVLDFSKLTKSHIIAHGCLWNMKKETNYFHLVIWYRNN